MDSIPLKPETAAQLEEVARLRGRDPIDVANHALREWLTQEREDFEDACRGIERGHADFEAGRSRPARDVLNDLRRKHDVPR
jgi:predicted transcriptional regulator